MQYISKILRSTFTSLTFHRRPPVAAPSGVLTTAELRRLVADMVD